VRVEFASNLARTQPLRAARLGRARYTRAWRGDAAAGGAKKVAKLETGLEVQVPLFMKEGEIVRVNTQTSEVAGRA